MEEERRRGRLRKRRHKLNLGRHHREVIVAAITSQNTPLPGADIFHFCPNVAVNFLPTFSYETSL